MRYLLTAILLLALLAGSFLAGSWYKDQKALKSKALSIKPQPTNSNGTGKDTPIDADMDASALPPGTVRITADKQQVVGVKTGVVENAAAKHIIRTVGRVAPDEKRVYRLVAGVDGWIRETYNNDTGTLVNKDERLAAFYSPQFRTTQINYLSVLGSAPDERYDAGKRQALAPSQLATVSIKTYVDALESLGMSEQQIKELASTRQVTDKVYIVAPATGFIIARNVSPGQRFEKGTEWYRIADLSRVWILADLYGLEARHFRPGMTVKVSLPDQGKSFQARVSNVQPQFDPSSRTLKLRLEADNPGFTLRPDMFVDVELPVQMPPAITVPTDAILDSGLKKTVFVDRGQGFFEPREVKTGWRMGNRVEILEGLATGERIVLSGTFLLDSESRMEQAAAGMSGSLVIDPVSGEGVSMRKAEKAGLKSTYRQKTYYFASEENKKNFEKNRDRYTAKPSE
jgi:membrane fusion protein, copper/silver efflux system